MGSKVIRQNVSDRAAVVHHISSLGREPFSRIQHTVRRLGKRDLQASDVLPTYYWIAPLYTRKPPMTSTCHPKAESSRIIDSSMSQPFAAVILPAVLPTASSMTKCWKGNYHTRRSIRLRQHVTSLTTQRFPRNIIHLYVVISPALLLPLTWRLTRKTDPRTPR